MQNAENKSKKFVVLATYVVAVICLLAGLFLPLFNGKEVLALKLGDVFKSLLNKENDFSLSYTIKLLGTQKLQFDFMALVIVLYLVVTALAVVGFAPVALSVRKEGKIAKKIYYGIEIAAIIVLSLYFVAVIYMYLASNAHDVPSDNISVSGIGYNMVIAACGTVIALLALSGMDKGKAAVIKIALFLLSAVAFLALFDITLLSSKFATPFNGKLSPALVSTGSGVYGLNQLFVNDIQRLCEGFSAKDKALIILTSIVPTVVLINFFIDTIKLATKKDRKFGRIFDIARYGLELASAVCLLITAIIAKTTIGVLLIVLLAVAAIQLAIVIIRFILGLKNKDNERVDDGEGDIPDDEPDNEPVEEYNDETPLLTDDYNPEEDYNGEQPYAADEIKEDDDGYLPPSEDEYNEPEDEDDDDGYVSPEEDALANGEHVEEPAAEEATEDVKPAEDEIDYEIKTEGTYLLPAEEEPVKEEPAPEEEAIKEPEEVEPENAETGEEEPAPVEEPEEEAIEEPDAEPEEIEDVKPAEESPEEPVQKPYREEIKPYNPYERHNNNNPFRNFEQPPQPYNPYAQQAAKPEQKPVQPVCPAYEPPKREQKPATSYKPYEPATERPQSARPLRPRPIIQEFKPVPPISEQPQREKQVYTIDKLYAGPLDDFIRKLSNDERIEFAMTFIEKSKGELGSIPDYVVGGDNKKFFQLSFIYLGRVRGLVSDGLLNKMYKELNML